MYDDQDPYDDDELIDCPSCGESIYADAPRCPECGDYVVDGKPNSSKKGLLYVVIIAILILAMAGLLFPGFATLLP